MKNKFYSGNLLVQEASSHGLKTKPSHGKLALRFNVNEHGVELRASCGGILARDHDRKMHVCGHHGVPYFSIGIRQYFLWNEFAVEGVEPWLPPMAALEKQLLAIELWDELWAYGELRGFTKASAKI